VPILLASAATHFGITVPGQISGKNAQRGGKGSSRYHVDFTYQVDEQNFASRMSVEKRAYERINIGDRVQVRILPLAPAASAFVTSLNTPSDVVCTLSFFCFASVMFVWVSYSEVVQFLRRRHLARFGKPTLGHITDKQVYRGKSTRYGIVYRYETPKGAASPKRVTHEGTTVWVSQLDYEATQIGEEITVLYDPDHPDRSMLYRYAEYSIVGLN